MLRIILNWRYWILLAIGSAALIGIFGSPDDYEGFAWWVAFFVSKAIGFYLGYLYGNKRWYNKDK